MLLFYASSVFRAVLFWKLNNFDRFYVFPIAKNTEPFYLGNFICEPIFVLFFLLWVCDLLVLTVRSENTEFLKLQPKRKPLQVSSFIIVDLILKPEVDV
jgi:hypothetical protein